MAGNEELRMLLSEKDKQIRDFSFQLEEKNAKIKSLEEKVTILLREDGVLRETTKNFENTIMGLREQLDLMKREKNKLTEQLIQSSTSTSNGDDTQLAQMNQKLSDLEKEKAKLEVDMQQQSNFWNERAKNQKIRFLEIQKKCEELEAKFKQAEGSKVELEGELLKVTRSYANQGEELTQSKRSRDEALTIVSSKDSQIKQLIDEVSNLKTQLDQGKRELGDRILHEQNLNKKLLNQHVDESNQKQAILRKEIAILQQQLTDMEQSVADERIQLTKMTEKASDLELALSEKSSEISKLTEISQQLSSEIESKNKVQNADRQRLETAKQENEELKLSIAKITEKYSKMEVELNAMSIRKEEIVTRHQQAIEEIRKEHSENAQQMRDQIAELTNNYEDAKSTSTYYKSYYDSHVAEIASLKNDISQLQEQIEDIGKERNLLRSATSALEMELLERKAEIEEQKNQINTLSTSVDELENQSKIEAKKSQRLIKDLQSQLQKARSEHSAVQRTNSAQMFGGNSIVSQPRKASVQNVSVSNKVEPESPNISAQDLEVLAEKIAELQQKNFVLEETNKGLLDHIEELKNDLANKTLIFQHFVINDMQLQGRSTFDMDKSKAQRSKEGGIMGRFFGGKEQMASPESVQSEINAKLTAVMEETILKNLQLQSDLKVLGDEITRLAEENLSLISENQSRNLPS